VERWDAIVIGAGAAGMMCAARAGQRGRKVLLVEHHPKLGEKIRISGGGRCNFTNLHCSPDDFLSRNPDFCRSALARYTPKDFLRLVESHGIPYHEKTKGQLFCDDSSRRIIDLLKAECDLGRVEWRMPCGVGAVSHDGGEFSVESSHGTFRSRSLVVATGGLTVPKIGATPFGYRIAERFGVGIVPPRPGLVPLRLDPETLARFGALSGVSVNAEVSCNGARFRENVLLTHRGLSGPAILQVSSYWSHGEGIEIDLLPGRDAEAWLLSRREGRMRLDTLLAEALPKRFAETWAAERGGEKPVHTLSTKALRDVARDLARWTVNPSGTLGFDKAEVTLGGVDTTFLSSRSMEARTVPGLHFIGEVVDVTGHLGGFNFQWAWASGHAAGEAIGSSA
jgi:predicted Rossmann fold flavoprotein